MKACPKCKQTKALTEFYNDKSKKDGLSCWCKDCKKEASNGWQERNKDRANAKKTKWAKENPAKVKATLASAYANNKERYRHHCRLRSARLRGADGTYGESDIQRLVELQKGRCACCGSSIKGGFHVDHVHPIALGGSNWPSNLQLLCAPCNLQKNAKHPIEFMQSKGFLL